MFENVTIPVYLFKNDFPRNLIQEQFSDKPEFDVRQIKSDEKITEWGRLLEILGLAAAEEDNDLIIVCRNSHRFAKNYEWNYFLQKILEAHKYGAGVLLGSLAGFRDFIKGSMSLFEINWFEYSPFMVLYRSIYNNILSIGPISGNVNIFHQLSQINMKKLVFNPFISSIVFDDLSITEKLESRKSQLSRFYKGSVKRFEVISNILATQSKNIE